MNDKKRTKLPYASLTEALHQIFNMKQYEKENLINNTKISKQANSALKYYSGTDILKKFIENTKESRNIKYEVNNTLGEIIWYMVKD